MTLDGPPHIAKRGQAISRHAEGLVRGAKGYQHGVENPRTDGTRVHTTLLAEAYSGHLATSMDAFAKEASAYLNSGKLPQRRRWPFSRTSANG